MHMHMHRHMPSTPSMTRVTLRLMLVVRLLCIVLGGFPGTCVPLPILHTRGALVASGDHTCLDKQLLQTWRVYCMCRCALKA